MMSFILASQNTPFAVALALMLLIAILEGVATVLGMGLSGFLDALLPDWDIDADIDGSTAASTSPFGKTLGWLRIGKVPLLVLLVIFLTSFGLLGFGVQSFFQRTFGTLSPPLIASLISFFLSLPVVRLCGGAVAKIIPKDETEAVAEKSFVGLVAVVTLGKAKKGGAAQGKLTDRFGQTHYVMIEPDDPDEEFSQGAEVLLVKQQGAIFAAIRNPSAILSKMNNA